MALSTQAKQKQAAKKAAKRKEKVKVLKKTEIVKTKQAQKAALLSASTACSHDHHHSSECGA